MSVSYENKNFISPQLIFLYRNTSRTEKDYTNMMIDCFKMFSLFVQYLRQREPRHGQSRFHVFLNDQIPCFAFFARCFPHSQGHLDFQSDLREVLITDVGCYYRQNDYRLETSTQTVSSIFSRPKTRHFLYRHG